MCNFGRAVCKKDEGHTCVNMGRVSIWGVRHKRALQSHLAFEGWQGSRTKPPEGLHCWQLSANFLNRTLFYSSLLGYSYRLGWQQGGCSKARCSGRCASCF